MTGKNTVLGGVQERNRTADTGIFNPSGTAVNLDEFGQNAPDCRANGKVPRGAARRLTPDAAAERDAIVTWLRGFHGSSHDPQAIAHSISRGAHRVGGER
jgi:hypothetical protein